ncbi:VIT and VWA domain-containing protein [Lentisphaerota bacterium ZTH]|nr:VWA domain-containing protein [Lentisphaerota bacterium]WET06934.1 VIT and VWA domain-containing protein [Lentisphaerota bacterium ZTH]
MTNNKSGLYSIAKNKPVVLTGINIASKVDKYIAETLITQHYRNSEDVNIEAVYCFPIENPAALHSFKIVTDRGEIRGTHDEKERGYDVYDQSLESGDSAYKLELEQKNMIELAIGNIAPNEDVTVSIEIISHLPVVDGTASLRIPTALSPLYVPAGISWESSTIASPPFHINVPYHVKVEACIDMEGIRNLRSPSHDILVEQKGAGYRVILNNYEEPPDRDFILEFELDDPGLGKCLVSRHQNGHRAALIKLHPEFELADFDTHVGSDIIFMFDCSNSMAYSYIEPAKEALELCMRSMSEGDYFNVLTFGSSHKLFSAEQMPYTQSTLEFSLNMLAEVKADMGGTEMLEALNTACDIPVMPGCRREVILITDGEVYNTREILKYVSKHNNNARFYTFGIGRGASPALVRGLADATGGQSEIIAPGEKIQEKVLRQFSRMIQPTVSDFKLKAKNAKFRVSDWIQPLYDGDCLTILAEVEDLSGDAEVTINVRIHDQVLNWKYSVEDLGEDDKISLLWAVSQINELEESSYLDQTGAGVYKKRILDIAGKFDIISHYSTLLAVEERHENEKALYYPSFRIVPIMLHRARSVSEPPLEDLMASVHETSESYLLNDYMGSASSSWYHEVLKTQDASGRFCSYDSLMPRLQLVSGILEEHLNRHSDCNPRREALLTAFIVNLLKTDPEASSVAARAVKKAEKWLDTVQDKDCIMRDSRELLNAIKQNIT